MALNSTQRFSSRVDNYVRYRPGYPSGVIDVMREKCGLLTEHLVADIASGTGIFTRMLLENGNRVFAVEPNAEMREAGNRYLSDCVNFRGIHGTAEATTLFKNVVHFVTAAQAAHWFDPRKSNAEFKRILKPNGWLVLLWNERDLNTLFAKDYEELLNAYGTDYAAVRLKGRATYEMISEFFAPAPFQESTLTSTQEFDYAGLEGRLLSSSYAPEAGHPQHEPMLQALRQLFDRHQRNGRVKMEYETKMYYGQLT
jgi:SAM-dependent methyltransferase